MKTPFLIIFIFSAFVSYAQPVRLHIMGGFANYSGDIQQHGFTIEQAKGALTLGGTFTITDKLSVRGDYSFAQLAANDNRNIKRALVARNLNFRTNINELSLLGEYDILNLYKHKLSPYLFGGVGIFHFNPFSFDGSGNRVYLADLGTEGQGIISGKKEYKRLQVHFPLGAGIKYALSEDVHVGFEMGMRVLQTDYLDDVSTEYVDQDVLLAARGQQAVDFAFRGDELKINPTSYPPAGTIRGNSKVKDFYYFGLFRIGFRMNWFDAGDNSRSKRLNCPGKL